MELTLNDKKKIQYMLSFEFSSFQGFLCVCVCVICITDTWAAADKLKILFSSVLLVFQYLSLSLSVQMNEIVEASQSSTQELQEQIDMYKEKNRREMAELQKQLREGGLELEKSRLTAKTLQEEVGGGGGRLYQQSSAKTTNLKPSLKKQSRSFLNPEMHKFTNSTGLNQLV